MPMNCDKCQREVFLPFKCPYCGGYFCSEHRLPENHQCPQMEMARIPKEELPQVVVQRPGSYEYTISYGPSQKRKGQIYFSEKEVSHLAVATILVIGVGLSLIGFQNLLSSNLLVPAVTTAIFTISFLIHEIGHKITAQKRGLWAEFRLTIMGAVLTLISVISPFFKVISPGAVMIAGYADRQSLGKISIAGPSTNLVLSAVFFTVAVFSW
ncbi:MAG: AN1-type zinc finger domain-containing protein, partial [Candidatus Bathyarchaeia archaeon]